MKQGYGNFVRDLNFVVVNLLFSYLELTTNIKIFNLQTCLLLAHVALYTKELLKNCVQLSLFTIVFFQYLIDFKRPYTPYFHKLEWKL